jgi:hypothetical protein
MDYNAYFTGALRRLRTERRYRVFAGSSGSPAVSRTRFGIRRRAEGDDGLIDTLAEALADV